jgi:hypothetical protein
VSQAGDDEVIPAASDADAKPLVFQAVDAGCRSLAQGFYSPAPNGGKMEAGGIESALYP